MKKIFLVYIYLTSFINSSFSQSFEKNYAPIKSIGKLPQDFTLAASNRIQKELAANTTIQKRRHKKLNEELVINSNFDLNYLFQSGYILLNDTISNYVNAVANEIIQIEPELKGKLKIYVIKSTEVNAYCFENGTVFVNIGLISHLENEAQLAYILCHEFVHYIKQHSLKRVVEYDKINRNKAGKRTYEDKVLLMYQFSRENETEADTTGLSIFLKTNYDSKQASAALKMLHYSNLPFDDLKFEKYFFEDENYKLPEEYFLKEFNPISVDDNKDDTYQTHPNIVNRQKVVENLLPELKISSQEKKHIVSETTFKLVREITRFECCRMFLVERDYMSAFKWAFLLRQKYPDNLYVNKTLAKCLYALTLNKAGHLKFDENSYHNNAIPDYTKIEGSSQQVNYFFNQIPAKELGILTMRFFWQNHLKYPDDKLFNGISDSSLVLLSTYLSIKPDEFQTTIPANSVTESKYYSKAFIPYFNDTTFIAIFDNNTKNINVVETNNINGLKKFEFETKENIQKQKKKNQENNSDLNIEKLLVINPIYDFTIESKKEASYKIRTEAKEDRLINYIEQNLSLAKIKYELLDPKDFSENDIVKYNEYSELNTWLNERIDIGLENRNLVLGTENINEVVKKYNTKYVMLVSVNSIKYKANVAFKSLYTYAWGIFVIPIPFLIYWDSQPEQYTDIVLSVINMENGELVKTKKYSVKHIDSKDILNSYIFDFLYSLKK